MENTEKQSEKQSEWKSRELGALWVRSGKGQKYLSGQIKIETMPGVEETVKVVVFTNKGRDKNERAPDYVVYRSEDSKPQNKVEEVATQAAKEVSSAKETPTASTDTATNEDIPEELF
jgi:pimeloyl-CoA synthetase